MTRRLQLFALAVVLANPAWAVPAVSGDGACGIRAVDNESFLTCEGNRAPAPVGPVTGEPRPLPEEAPVVTLSCRFLESPAKGADESDAGGAVLLQCRPVEARRLAASRP